MQFSIPIAVGIGGCAGALLRFYISSAVTRAVGEDLAFVGTLAVNLIGCFLIGMLAIIVARTTHLSPHSQRVLITGLLGSLTTFSAFSLDSVNLLQQGRFGAAIGNILTNVVLGLLLVWLGMQVAGAVFTDPSEQNTEDRLSTSDSKA
jgi:CrcB protein